MFEDVLLGPDATFSKQEVRKFFSGLEVGRFVDQHLFGLALFEIWRKHHGITV